ncbi:hypothetical protein DFJ63DRAFT_54050 [Scheffersomyces coipomensis]|uniref:uncharacterized protein n=1 Tax=Scheffersomyces coipomensis TaxID=1788519 RepID=UPI00315D420A
MKSFWNIELDDDITIDVIRDSPLSPDQISTIYEKFSKDQDQYQSIPFEKLSFEDLFVLECIIIKSHNGYDPTKLLDFLKHSLDIPDGINWNREVDTSLKNKYYHYLRLLRVISNHSDDISAFVSVISYHINPHTPWSSMTNSLLIKDIISSSSKKQESIQQILPDFIAVNWKQNLLKIESTGKHTALNPRLGKIVEDDIRKSWKSSSKVKSISMTWFIISESNDIVFETNWRLLISFILNILDDHEPVFKYHACLLINLLLARFVKSSKLYLLKNSGLSQILSDSIKKCLNYLPPSTPESISGMLLEEAYRGLYLIIESSDDQVLAVVAIINDDIVSSLSRLLLDKPSKVTLLLIKQLDYIITNVLHTRVMLAFSKVVYLINQVITNGNLYWQTGLELDIILAALNTQNSLFEQFISLGDVESFNLISTYKYDFFGAWSIVLNRSNNGKNETLVATVKENLSQLAVIMERSDNKGNSSFNDIVNELSQKVPGMEKYLEIV